MNTEVIETSLSNINSQIHQLYFKAMSTKDVAVEYFHISEKNPLPDTFTTIRLPFEFDGIESRELHRVSLVHKSLHYELGTYSFNFQEFLALLPVNTKNQPTFDPSTGELEKFFRCFSDSLLARRIFEAVEDSRIDSVLVDNYPGLRRPLAHILDFERQRRPDLLKLSKRAAALEMLVRASLFTNDILVPIELESIAAKLLSFLQLIDLPTASVEQVAIITLKLYSIVVKLPTLGNFVGKEAIESSNIELISKSEYDEIWPNVWPEPPRSKIEGDDILTIELPQVLFRGSLESFVTDAPSAAPPDHQAIVRFRNMEDNTDKGYVKSIDHPGPPEPLPHDHHDVSRDLHSYEHGSLGKGAANCFLYPEWNVFESQYLKDWVRVQAIRPIPVFGIEKISLQKRYAKELARLKHHMEIPPAQAFITERRMPSGFDIDYDAAVEALLDLRLGGSITEDVYLDSKRLRRDLAVTLLLDVSASTSERVESAEPIELNLSKIVDYDRKVRPPRILDIEIVSALLCSTAVYGAGDALSIWSFSGTGREDVSMNQIKGFNEQFSGIVVGRAAALKPTHATRLGAAVRHCGSLLSRVQAETKVLIVLTDGRPYDIDYGAEYGEDLAFDYAVADSSRAFFELKQGGISSHVLTVDTQSEEYVSRFSSASVEILDDIKTLPEKLLNIYLELLGNHKSKKGVNESAYSRKLVNA